ncbi:MAG: hypothetical protein K8I27_13665 [Planctomycetes bacterium]|nr:hypothetical protein [Planctomycetota bacterium]
MFTKHTPVVVGWGLDRIAVNIIISQHLPRKQWERLRNGNPYDVDGTHVEVSGVYQEKEAFSRSAQLVIYDKRRKTPQGETIYSAVVGARACAAFGAAAVMATIIKAARTMISPTARIEANYLELYVDMQSTQRPSKAIFKQSSSKGRKRVFKDRSDVINPEGDTLQSSTWGDQGRRSDNICAVYYEKPRLQTGDWRIAKWRQSGQYLEGQTVRRLEFRVWGAGPLNQARISPDLTTLAAGGLNSLWDYLTSHWLRILSSTMRGHKRGQNHRMWKIVQGQRPLTTQPLLPREFLAPSSQHLDQSLIRAAGYLRSFAGLSDSDNDKALAEGVISDAAERLLDIISRQGAAPEPADE